MTHLKKGYVSRRDAADQGQTVAKIFKLLITVKPTRINKIYYLMNFLCVLGAFA